MIEPCAARVLDDQAALAAIGSLARSLSSARARPASELYGRALGVLARWTMRGWPALLVHWELLLLQDLGFGLDLTNARRPAPTPISSMSRRDRAAPFRARQASLTAPAAGATALPA